MEWGKKMKQGATELCGANEKDECVWWHGKMKETERGGKSISWYSDCICMGLGGGAGAHTHIHIYTATKSRMRERNCIMCEEKR